MRTPHVWLAVAAINIQLSSSGIMSLRSDQLQQLGRMGCLGRVGEVAMWGSNRGTRGELSEWSRQGGMMNLRGGWGEGGEVSSATAGTQDDCGDREDENTEKSTGGPQEERDDTVDGEARGCPHGKNDENKPDTHCMECEVMAFLQRAAAILQNAGGRMDSTMFAKQWTETYPGDPLSREQVASAVSGILQDSGYFHVEDTADPVVKMFELTEQAEDGAVLGEHLPAACMPYDLPPPEADIFVDRARKHLMMTGVGRHPALGCERMTNQELADKIIREEPTATTSRHDEHTYDGKWGEPIVGYWTLGACEGSNGCKHKGRITAGGIPHWTCCGDTDMMTAFCREDK